MEETLGQRAFSDTEQINGISGCEIANEIGQANSGIRELDSLKGKAYQISNTQRRFMEDILLNKRLFSFLENKIHI